jgi:hypothetical protein
MKTKTVDQIRSQLSLIWITATSPALVILVALTINGHFGYEAGGMFAGLGWLLPFWTPITTVVLVPIRARNDNGTEAAIFENRALLITTYVAMLVYCICIYMVIVLDAESVSSHIERIYLWSTWTFVPIQAMLIALLSKVFLE